MLSADFGYDCRLINAIRNNKQTRSRELILPSRSQSGSAQRNEMIKAKRRQACGLCVCVWVCVEWQSSAASLGHREKKQKSQVEEEEESKEEEEEADISQKQAGWMHSRNRHRQSATQSESESELELESCAYMCLRLSLSSSSAFFLSLSFSIYSTLISAAHFEAEIVATPRNRLSKWTKWNWVPERRFFFWKLQIDLPAGCHLDWSVYTLSV